MSAPTYTNVSVRLPQDVVAALKAEQTKTGARSVAAVLQKHLEANLTEGFSVAPTRHDRKIPRKVYSLRVATVERLRELADEHNTEIGSLIFQATQSLVDSYSPVSGRFRRPHDSVILTHAQAA